MSKGLLLPCNLVTILPQGCYNFVISIWDYDFLISKSISNIFMHILVAVVFRYNLYIIVLHVYV